MGNIAREENRANIEEAAKAFATACGHQMIKTLSKKSQELDDELDKWRALLKQQELDKDGLIAGHGEALFETYLSIIGDRIDVLERQKSELPDLIDTLLDCEDGEAMDAGMNWMERETDARVETRRRLEEFQKAAEPG